MADLDAASVDTSTDNQDDPLQDLSNEQISQLLHDTLRANEVLHTETQMFEKHLKKIDPSGKESFGMQQAQGVQGVSTHEYLGVKTGVGRKRSKSRSSTTERQLKLNAEQKCDIAQREIEEYRAEIEKVRQDSIKILDSYKAVMEEAEARAADIKKLEFEFDREILKGGIIPRTKKIMAEKVQRYLEEDIRTKETLVEKLRLKNATLKVQKKKLMMQLKQKEEMGEVLHEVDFNQLKIENQQYIEKIDERNQDLLRLKLMAGNTQQVLNNYKKRLNSLSKEAHLFRQEITARKDMHLKIDAETQIQEKERSKAEKINRKLRRQEEEYRVPPVMDYVVEKANLYELQKKVSSWERKVEIAEMALATNKKEWHQTKVMSQQAHMLPWQQVAAM